MSQIEISEFIKTKGQHFPNLVDLLSEKISKQEQRDVGLAFYKSSTLRVIRNKFVHEGYKMKITSEEVNDLLSDIEKFEKELFLETKSDKENTTS